MNTTTNWSNPQGIETAQRTSGAAAPDNIPAPNLNPGVATPIEQNNDYGASTNRLNYSAAIAAAGSVPAFAAPDNDHYALVSDIDLFNAGAAAVTVQIESSTSKVLWQASIPAGGSVQKTFATPIGGNGQVDPGTAISLVAGAGVTNLLANLNGFLSNG